MDDEYEQIVMVITPIIIKANSGLNAKAVCCTNQDPALAEANSPERYSLTLESTAGTNNFSRWSPTRMRDTFYRYITVGSLQIDTTLESS